MADGNFRQTPWGPLGLGPGLVPQVSYVRESADVPDPRYMTAEAAGCDLVAWTVEKMPYPPPLGKALQGPDLRKPEDFAQDGLVLYPGQRVRLGTGLRVQPPPGWFVALLVRSGLSWDGPTLANGMAVIDQDYTGLLQVSLANPLGSGKATPIRRGDRIAQLVLMPYVQGRFVEVQSLGDTARGAGGFGHTGK